MRYFRVRLTFAGPAHFGVEGIGQEKTAVTVRSDTLYSAIWSVWAAYGLRPDIAELLDAFASGAPPFRLSSAFIYDKEACYWPRPHLRAEGLEQDWKLDKAAQFLPTDLFRDRLQGRPTDAKALQEAWKRYVGSHEKVLRPRVELDRMNNRSSIYNTQEVSFAKGAGLWFLVQIARPDLLAPLQQAVALLGEDGLGGERSTGSGAFTADWEEDSQINELMGGGTAHVPHCLISLYNPAEGELPALLADAVGEVIERRGWAQSGNRAQFLRLPVKMLAEGAILPACPAGRVVDVTPEGWGDVAGHRVYRSGLAMAVPMPVRKEGGA